MKLTNEIKKQILKEFIKIFARIADKDYQKRVWIKAEGLECDDFDETSNQLLEAGDAILSDYKEFNISDYQYHLLTKFWKEFTEFSNGPRRIKYFPEDFVDTPEWEKITEMAKEILKAFNYQKK